MKTLILFLSITLLITFLNAQVNIDSLNKVWNDSNQADSSRLHAIKKISWNGHLFTQPDSAYYYAQLQYDFAKEKDDKKNMADALNTQGASYTLQAFYPEALSLYHRSLKLNKEIKNKKGVGVAYGNIGSSYQKMGDLKNALLNQLKSKKIKIELRDDKGLGKTLMNIGNIYRIQGNYGKAIDNYLESLKLKEKLNDIRGIGNVLNNLGSVYDAIDELDPAIEFYKKSLTYKRKINDDKGISNSLLNIGVALEKKNEIDSAMYYYQKCLEIKNKINDIEGKGIVLNNIGSLLLNKGSYDDAEEYFKKSLDIRTGMPNLSTEAQIEAMTLFYAREVDNIGISNSLNNFAKLFLIKNENLQALEYAAKAFEFAHDSEAVLEKKEAVNTLWQVHRNLGNYKKSLELYALYSNIKDSISSEENQKEVIRQEYKYEYEKQAVADSISAAEENRVKDAQLFAEKAKTKQQQQQSYFLLGILILSLIFGGVIFNRFRINNKQKGIIEKQKREVDSAFHILEEKNQEILDSISYAKRIQNAILPPQKLVKEYLNNSFIIYKPKDIVAGDFFWVEPTKKAVFFAVADCTGHGVPGAMVSVLCNNGLNRSVREHGLSDPGKILDKTREIIIQEFEKSEEEVKDGMDIALCSIEENKLKYAGAHNPLWIVRGGQVIEIKANKQPIGKFDTPKPYKTHAIDLQKGDTIYLFSDGYTDQFGGEKGKKFKSKAFKELLIRIEEKSMEEQKSIIDATFENWKGNLDQLDDVCIIGLRI